MDVPVVISELVERMIAEDVEGVLRCFDDEGSFQDPTGRFEGREALEAFFSTAFALVSDIRWDVHRGFRSGDELCLEWTFSYTLGGTKAAGRRVVIEGASVMELRSEKLRRWRDYWDAAPVLARLGVSSWEELLG